MKNILTCVLFVFVANVCYGHKIVTKKPQTKYIWQEAIIKK